MVKHSRGYRTRSRSLLRKSPRERGAIPPLSRLMVDYKEGDQVVIKINSSVHSGMPHRRYQGKVGKIVGRRGKAYMVSVSIGDKQKLIIIRPEHLVPFSPTR
ncbi:50S ribosomal protein L21e [Sulfolobus tengchongensis]|uniref:Large ribosomal subunit protein eL21 n=1 Tax=Sulfolobus tengchongensis TaxID=207809 RepID=A0AAX4L101_9CREN